MRTRLISILVIISLIGIVAADPVLFGPYEVISAGGGGGASSGNDGFNNLSIADQHIATNRSEMAGFLNASAINFINGNLSAGGSSGNDGFNNLSIADSHIASNQSPWQAAVLAIISGWFTTNNSATQAASIYTSDQHTATNFTNLVWANGTLFGNHTGTQAYYDHIGEKTGGHGIQMDNNIYTSGIYINPGSLLYTNNITNRTTAGLTINSNITLIGEGRITGIRTISDNTDAANKSYVDTAVSGVSASGIDSRIESNRTAAINASARIADDHILTNRSTLEGMISSNLSVAGANLSSYAGASSNITLSASSFFAPTTNGATELVPNETKGKSYPSILGLNFNSTVTGVGNNATSTAFTLPGNFRSASPYFNISYYWTASSGEATQTVNWTSEAACMIDGTTWPVYGANVTATDSYQGPDKIHVVQAGPLTPSGTVQAGSLCIIQTRRINGAGTVPADVTLIAERIGYASNP